MFGHNHMLGDLVEVVGSQNGRIETVVQNVPEDRVKERPFLSERIDRLQSQEWNPSGVNGQNPIEVISLEQFSPDPESRYIIGFPGEKMVPLLSSLKDQYGLYFSPIAHATAIVSQMASLGEGTILHAGVIIGSGVVVGGHSLVNKGTVIGHDVLIDEFVTVQIGVRIAGHVILERGAYIGAGATVLEDIRVGAGATVAAGSVVLEDVPPRTVVAGVPAAVKKQSSSPTP